MTDFWSNIWSKELEHKAKAAWLKKIEKEAEENVNIMKNVKIQVKELKKVIKR
jgi:hypothetical protein